MQFRVRRQTLIEDIIIYYFIEHHTQWYTNYSDGRIHMATIGDGLVILCLCNRTRAYKMRAYSISQDKRVSYVIDGIGA